MKSILTTTILFLSMTLFSFTTPGEESVYESSLINYNVVKTNGVVIFSVDLKDAASYEQVILMRSDKPTGTFRNVRELSKADIDKLVSDNEIIDKYPLPNSVTSYYKLQTVDQNGVYRSYPCVKLTNR